MFNLIYAHLLNRREHTQDCEETCSADCSVQQLLDELDAPLMPWEIEEEARFRRRRRALERGEISA